MKEPSKQDVARALCEARDQIEACPCQADHEDGHEPSGCEGVVDVRLQVYDSGAWAVRVGDASYDLDHHGHWGSGMLAHDETDDEVDALAEDLIEQVLDSAAEEAA